MITLNEEIPTQNSGFVGLTSVRDQDNAVVPKEMWAHPLWSRGSKGGNNGMVVGGGGQEACSGDGVSGKVFNSWLGG